MKGCLLGRVRISISLLVLVPFCKLAAYESLEAVVLPHVVLGHHLYACVQGCCYRLEY